LITSISSAFFPFRNAELPKADEREMNRVWRSLGDVLGIMIVIDEIISRHPALRSHFHIYVKSIQVASHNPSQFGVATGDMRLKALNDALGLISSKIIAGKVFKVFKVIKLCAMLVPGVILRSSVNDELTPPSVMTSLSLSGEAKMEHETRHVSLTFADFGR